MIEEILQELQESPSGLTVVDISESKNLCFDDVCDSLRHAIADGYVVKGKSTDEGVIYEITPKGQAYLKGSKKSMKLPKNLKAKVEKSALTQTEKTTVKAAKPAPIVGKSPLEQKQELPDFVPINFKTDDEINRHINGTACNVDAGKHYRYEFRGIKLDPFRIADIYGITDFAMQTILKKCLRAGRAHKDLEQDLRDIICAAERKLEMIKEDAQ